MTTIAIDDNDWLNLESKMSKVLSTQKSQSTTLLTLLSTIQSNLNALTTTHPHRLQQTSHQIQSKLEQQIQMQQDALQRDNAVLHTQLGAIQTWTSTKDQLIRDSNSIATQLSKAQEHIHRYQQESQVELGNIDQIELNSMKSIPKIKHELTLHAMMTNIKWDYSAAEQRGGGGGNHSGEVLKGEVSLVDRGVLREFEIEKDCVGGECEVAERLWGIIEGV